MMLLRREAIMVSKTGTGRIITRIRILIINRTVIKIKIAAIITRIGLKRLIIRVIQV